VNVCVTPNSRDAPDTHPDTAGKKETSMASLHPADRVSGARKQDRARSDDGPHPSICGIAGFGVIAAAGVLTHLLFRLMVQAERKDQAPQIRRPCGPRRRGRR
jgi:hypothetical protein